MQYDEPMEERHQYLINKFSEVPAPFGLQGIDESKLEKLKVRDVSIVWFKHPDTKKVIQKYTYLYRTKDNESETKAYSNDKLFFEFEPWYDKINFADIWHVHFPKAIEIYEPRRADSSYSKYRVCYQEGYKPGEKEHLDENGHARSIVPEYNALKEKGIIPDGDFNIFTLSPVVYWNKAMCLDALGFDRDEVIRRLEGKVLHIRPLNDGVYIVFNDNPLLSFDDFLAIQHIYKPLLGLSPPAPEQSASQGRLKSWLGKLGSVFSE